MPKSCSAFNCTNRFVKGSGITFHRFPLSNKQKLGQWICSIRRKDFIPTTHSFICSKHFSPDCFYKNHISRTLLKEDAIPTLFDFPDHLKRVQKTERPPKQNDLETILPLHSVEDNIHSEENISEIKCESDSIVDTYCNQDSLKTLKRKHDAIVDKKDVELNELKKNLKLCKFQVSRKDEKVKFLIDIISDLKEINLVSSVKTEALQEN